jgi:hypothetical protein
MSEAPPQFPANVVLQVREKLHRREKHLAALEMHPRYNGYDDFSIRESEKVSQMYQDAIDKITADVIAITTRHFPNIQIDKNPEVTISNILAAAT